MELKVKTVVDRLDGVGDIMQADGTSVGRHRYSLVVYQDMHVLDDGTQIAGLKSIEGTVTLRGAEGALFVVEGAELTLRLEDGRSLPFFFTDSNGKIAARGALE